jgi:cytochrome c oxidase assembly factor CtaG
MRAVNPALALVQYICSSDGAGLWTFDLWITLPLMLSAALYGTGLTSLWRRAGAGRGVPAWCAGCYAAGWLVLVLALVSPIHRWGTGLFSIHMIEHELVMAGAAPLLVLGRPGGTFAWGLPSAIGKRLGAMLRASKLRAAWAGVTRPVAATLIHGVAIWAWHAPLLFDAAVANVMLHRLQHISFLATGLLFWWALLRRRNPGIAAAHLFATMLHTSILGAIVALAPHVLYRLQTMSALRWGITPLQDQQLAGLIMWVPAGLIYAGAALVSFALWVKRSASGTVIFGPAAHDAVD